MRAPPLRQSRTLAIGDMHVQFVALRALLELARVSETDHVIFLGDYVDGGPESAQVLDFLSEFVRPPTVVALRN